MSNLDPRIEAVRAKYDLEQTDFWKIPQNGQWVCKHAALEVVAVKAKVEWLPPMIIEKDAPGLVTSMIVTGRMGERIEWATGETNPTNYSVKGKQPAYPWAMSEKRAKDRVVLKLVGIHGLVYSEDELSGDAEQSPVPQGRAGATPEASRVRTPASSIPERSSEPRVAANPVVGNIGGDRNTPTSSGTRLREEDEATANLYGAIQREIEEAANHGMDTLTKVWKARWKEIQTLPDKWELNLVDQKNNLKELIKARSEAK